VRNEEICKLMERQEDSIKELFSAHNTALGAKIEAENAIVLMRIETLTDYQQIQNNRTEKLEESVSEIKEDTRIWRLIHRNPKITATITILSILGLVGLFILKNVIL